MTKEIEDAITKAKEIVEKMGLGEPYKSLTYSKLLEVFIAESVQASLTSIVSEKNESVSEIPQIKKKKNFREAIIELLSSNWGNVPRTTGEIKEALELNALYMESKTIASTLIQMVKNNKLRRIKKGEIFAYIVSNKE